MESGHDPWRRSFFQGDHRDIQPAPGSAVLAAARSASPGFRDAWSRLAEAYWYPLYALIRRRGYSAEDTEALTQACFAHLTRSKALDGRGEGEGRF